MISVREGLLFTLLSCAANIIRALGKSCFLGMAPLGIKGEEEALVALLLSRINSREGVCASMCLSCALPVRLSNSCFCTARASWACAGDLVRRGWAAPRQDVADKSCLHVGKGPEKHFRVTCAGAHSWLPLAVVRACWEASHLIRPFLGKHNYKKGFAVCNYFRVS